MCFLILLSIVFAYLFNINPFTNILKNGLLQPDWLGVQLWTSKAYQSRGKFIDKAMKRMLHDFATTVQWSFSEMMIWWNWNRLLKAGRYVMSSHSELVI
jgi:hypothetical protein